MEQKVEQIKPYDQTRSKTSQVEQMFDSIAPAYDFMNCAMTLGIDKWWRRRAVRLLAKSHPQRILDIATGTGDLALLMQRTLHPRQIVGLDLSAGMLDIAREKLRRALIQADTCQITFEQGDSLNMRFADGSFDAITVAYGVRNFEHLDQGYREMCRVLAPGGVLCVIELSLPTNPLVKPLYDLYTRHIIPLVGRGISKDPRAYTYLPQSIAAVAQGQQMLQLMRDAGFTDTRHIPMTFGVCSIYIARKP